jgi:hypothetical protein
LNQVSEPYGLFLWHAIWSRSLEDKRTMLQNIYNSNSFSLLYI